ncbi:MAG: hypothetical protein QXN37_02660, partial [Candidatus Anstonellaceae archaeon]
MVAFTFDALYHTVLVFLFAFIPGIALGFPLLKKSKLSFTEKLFVSFFIGLFAVPTLLFLQGLAGVHFSLSLVLLNFFILTAIGIFFGIKNEAFKPPKIDFPLTAENLQNLSVSFLLFFIALLAFWLRIQTYSPIYSELDPYWYVYSAAQILQFGAVPPIDDTAWWPEANSSHRSVPLKAYLEAQWYTLYTGGKPYDNYLLFTTSSWLPPISAALLSFGAYLLVSSVYERRYGLLAAFLITLMPLTIFKMSAGVNEAAPVGFMGLFVSLGTFAWSLYKKDHTLLLVSSYAFFVSTLASNVQVVLALPLAGIMVIQGIDYFVRGKPNTDFVKECGIILAGFVLGSILLGIYINAPLLSLLGSKVLMAVVAFIFLTISSFALQRHSFSYWQRVSLIALLVFAGLILLISPLGAPLKNEIRDYVAASQFVVPLQKTIAEQNRAGNQFEGEAGFIALVPKNHKGIIFEVLDAVSLLFSLLANALFATMDFIFKVLVNITDTTDKKENSLVFVFLIISAVGLVIEHFAREKDEREHPSVFLLILLFALPITYVGLNKLKYTIYAVLSFAIFAAVSLAVIEKAVIWAGKRFKIQTIQEHAKAAFLVLIFLLVYAQATFPFGYAKVILLKSFETRYQDDPLGVMPKVANLCQQLSLRGVSPNQIQSLCLAGSDPNFASDIDRQFDFDVCWLSQMNIDELFPSTNEERQASSEAAFSARFRCNRIASYWIEAMEWIRKNLDYDDRLTSWWDYGHWTNYLGERKTVLRNEHISTNMIGRVAHDFIIGTPEDLAESMRYFESKHVLFDYELIGGLG